ncbi:hypothetical protein [Flavobacterium caeni]|uniref:Uncharacterized protein n=1 Tax=Flavobacterium caeni TaxID=490189 RepID=A0A1G5K2X9_9FLAO|nr:hypothetical protein [Flavobacterium caeni]SCY94450.1 hypothetical protein SAMN02927903_03028 [Flavobacterium caeni]
MEYENLSDIVAQLEKCEYKTVDGLHDLKDNSAFIALKKISEAPELNVPVINISRLYENLIIMPLDTSVSPEVAAQIQTALTNILKNPSNKFQ